MNYGLYMVLALFAITLFIAFLVFNKAMKE